MFQTGLLGLQSDSSAEAISSLREMGYSHSLKIDMPGEIIVFLGRKLSGKGKNMQFDVLNAKYQDYEIEDGNFLVSGAGITNNYWFPLLVVGGLAIVILIWTRRQRS